MNSQWRSFIESQFTLVLIVGFLAGLFMPGLENVPKITASFLIAAIMFYACSKITVSDLKTIKISDIAGFYVFRFLVFPFVVFYVFSWILPDYKFAFLLLALLPCGATLSAMTAVMKGNPSLGLSATVLTSFLAPFVIPLAFALVSDIEMEFDVLGMFKTLSAIIFIPIVVYFGFVRRFEPAKTHMRENASVAAILLITCVVAIIVASQREHFFQNIDFLIISTLLAISAYLVFYMLGWFLFAKKDIKTRISYTLMSGNNNIALGISLAFLYLPEKEVLMLVMCEMPWVIMLSVFKLFLEKTQFKNKDSKA